MESFFRREKSTADLYPDISPDKIKHAEQFLSLVSEGTIKTINIDKQSALETLKKLRSGTMESYTVESHAANYLDYINGET
jgi:hypothetical protein